MPRARVVVATAGRPSGTAATANEMAVLNMISKPYPLRSPIPNTTAQAAPEMSTSWSPRRLSCRSMGVSGEVASPTKACNLPTSVYAPVATTTATPCPPVTSVPM